MTTPQNDPVVPFQLGKNLQYVFEKNNQLVLIVDMNQRVGRTSTDKNTLIATSEGFVNLFDDRGPLVSIDPVSGKPCKIKINMVITIDDPPPLDTIEKLILDCFEMYAQAGQPLPDVPTDEMLAAFLDAIKGLPNSLYRHLFPRAEDAPAPPEVE